MEQYEKVKNVFLEDTKNHKLKVELDTGPYKHFILSDGSNIFKYQIITSPGHLFYFGDMGAYTFSKRGSMLNFFSENMSLSYFHEKLIAEDTVIGSKKYDEDVFKEVIRKAADMYEKLKKRTTIYA